MSPVRAVVLGLVGGPVLFVLLFWVWMVCGAAPHQDTLFSV